MTAEERQDQLNEKIRQLISLSKTQGYLTNNDISKALPKNLDRPEDIENVISILENLETQIIDEDDVETHQAKIEKTRRKPYKPQSDIVDDPVRMYFKQMGQVPLLPERKKLPFPNGLRRRTKGNGNYHSLSAVNESIMIFLYDYLTVKNDLINSYLIRKSIAGKITSNIFSAIQKRLGKLLKRCLKHGLTAWRQKTMRPDINVL